MQGASLKPWLGRYRVTIWSITDFADELWRAPWSSRWSAQGPTEAQQEIRPWSLGPPWASSVPGMRHLEWNTRRADLDSGRVDGLLGGPLSQEGRQGRRGLAPGGTKGSRWS